jgi:hypothetical protein
MFEWVSMLYIIINERNRRVEEITYDHGAENIHEPISQPIKGYINNKLKVMKKKLKYESEDDQLNFDEDQLMYRRMELQMRKIMLGF